MQLYPHASIASARPARRRGLASFVAVCAVLSGCATTSPEPPSPGLQVIQIVEPTTDTATPTAGTADAGTGSYHFAVGDEFDLRIPDAPQFDQTLKVRPDGKVSLALIGTVHVLGRTPEDVEAEMRERLVQLSGEAGDREYLLQPGDQIEVKFPYQPELNELLRIRPDGKLQMQMIGTMVAEGKSPEELQKSLRGRYGKFLKVPELSVIVREVTTQNVRVAGGNGRAGLSHLQPSLIVRSFQPAQVFFGGEVQRPGVLAWRGGMSLLQALTEVGGQLPTGDLSELMVLRHQSDGSVQMLKPGFGSDGMRQPDRDVLLQPSDVVVLPKSDAATLADRLNAYVFNLVPFLRNSSFGFVYDLRGNNNYTN